MIVASILMGLVGWFVTILFIWHRSVNVPAPQATELKIRLPTAFDALGSCEYTIIYNSISHPSGTVVLRGNFDYYPMILVDVKTNKGSILCLYEEGVLRLLKIETDQPCDPFWTATFLDDIVESSFCKIEKGNEADWRYMLDYLEHLPTGQYERESTPGLDLGVTTLSRHCNLLIPRIKEQIDRMYKSKLYFDDFHRKI